MATTLSLLLLGAVVRMFGDVGQGITDSRAMLESADRLRVVQARLQQDLAGVTVTMNPPRKPENNEGYFEYIEGPVGTQRPTAATMPVNPATMGQQRCAGHYGRRFRRHLDVHHPQTGRPFVGKSVMVRTRPIGRGRGGVVCSRPNALPPACCWFCPMR